MHALQVIREMAELELVGLACGTTMANGEVRVAHTQGWIEAWLKGQHEPRLGWICKGRPWGPSQESRL